MSIQVALKEVKSDMLEEYKRECEQEVNRNLKIIKRLRKHVKFCHEQIEICEQKITEKL